MFRSHEFYGGNIVTCAGIQVLQSLPTSVNHAQTNERTKGDEGIKKACEILTEGTEEVPFEQVLESEKLPSLKKINLDRFFIDYEKESSESPESVIIALPEANVQFKEATPVVRTCDGDSVRHSRGYKSILVKAEGGQNPFDLSSLPDEDYLDAVFAPLPKEDRSGTTAGDTWVEFLEGVQNASLSKTAKQLNATSRITVGGNDAICIDMSDEDYIDRMFAPLPLADRMELERARGYRSGINIGTPLNAPKDCPIGAGRADGVPCVTLPDALPCAIAAKTHVKRRQGIHRKIRVGVGGHPEAAMVCSHVKLEGRWSSEALCESGHEQNPSVEYAGTARSQPIPIKTGAPIRAKVPAKRKRPLRKKVAGVAKDTDQARPPKRRGGRVDDLGPTDVPCMR